jgi:cellulose synthase/poly-beta-1,6-N-acetylglucosamine synthase-like glycosyltransferase
MEKVTFITTVLNEEKTIKRLLVSLFHQTRHPHEIIMVDGGSTDKTKDVIDETIREYKSVAKRISIHILERKGNRSVGRNAAIEKATGEIIVCSDGGCILDKRWVEEISKPFSDNNVDVVAGYYKGEGKTAFQKSLIPYVLVMEDRVNPKTFLPATRSMAFRKAAWKDIGKFPEQFSHNEDYVFAQRLKTAGKRIVYNGKAIVTWVPRANIWQAFKMFYRFAKGDVQAKILRPKVVLVFVRYLLLLELLIGLIVKRNVTTFSILIGGVVLYLIWAIAKNYHYVRTSKAFFYLPLIQITADKAVMLGSIAGIFSKK